MLASLRLPRLISRGTCYFPLAQILGNSNQQSLDKQEEINLCFYLCYWTWDLKKYQTCVSFFYDAKYSKTEPHQWIETTQIFSHQIPTKTLPIPKSDSKPLVQSKGIKFLLFLLNSKAEKGTKPMFLFLMKQDIAKLNHINGLKQHRYPQTKSNWNSSNPQIQN